MVGGNEVRLLPSCSAIHGGFSMTRFDRLKAWPEKLEIMSEDELRAGLSYWSMRHRELGHREAQQSAANRARTVQSIIVRRFPGERS
jgi:hypothetical protein